MKSIHIGGVPEHFNLPWRAVTGSFGGYRLAWQDFPGGTGAMVEALASGALDMAVLLTEGAVAARRRGADFEIVSTYTDSPLHWGIHTPASAGLADEADIRGRRIAISRRGSGSHLMAVAHALRRGWPTTGLELVVVGSLDGARRAFAEDRADVFFWERFMTKPLVDSGEFTCVGEFSAEWPAFVICAKRDLVADHGPVLTALVGAGLAAAQRFATDEGSVDSIVAEYGLTPADAHEWLSRTRWSQSMGLDRAMLEHVAELLHLAGVIDAS